MALLRKHGINSKMIQSMDGLRFGIYGRNEILLKPYKQADKNTVNHRRTMGRSQTCNLFYL